MLVKQVLKKLLLFVLLTIRCSFVNAQDYNEPQNIPALLKQLNGKLSVPLRTEVLNRISYGYSLIFKADSGIFYAEKALILAEKFQLQREMARSHNNIGLALQQLGVHSEAIREFEIGISLATQLPDQKLIAWLNYGIGHSYYMMNLPDKGIRQQHQTLNYAVKNRIYEIIPIANNLIGNTFFRQNKLDSAQYYFGRALSYAQQYDNEFMLMAGYKNLGKVYLLKNDRTKGFQALWKSIEIASNSKVRHIRNSVVLSYECMANYEYERGNYQQSIVYASRSLKLASEYDATEDTFDASNLLYKAHKAAGNAEEALKYLELNQETKETMYNGLEVINQEALENRLQVARQRTNISLLEEKGLRERQQQIWLVLALIFSLIVGSWLFWLYRLVGRQKELIRANNLQLEKEVIERTDELELAYIEVESAVTKGQTKERKRIAADIHDNLGGILSSVSIGIELMDQTGLSDRERQILKNIKNQISDAYDEVRLLSHNLRPDIIEKEGVKVALSRMAQRITLVHRIKVNLDLQYTRVLSKVLEYNLYAMIMELLNNVVKHAEASEVWVSIQEAVDTGLLLQVEDNGKGFGAAHVRELDGTGLLNIKERLDQMNGKMDYTSGEGRTIFRIEIP